MPRVDKTHNSTAPSVVQIFIHRKLTLVQSPISCVSFVAFHVWEIIYAPLLRLPGNFDEIGFAVFMWFSCTRFCYNFCTYIVNNN